MNIDLIGHLITTLSFIGVAVYALIRQRRLQRTTRNSTALFFVIIGISLLFAAINLYRSLHRLLNIAEFPMEEELDLISQYSSIFIQSVLILILFASKIEIQPDMRVGRVLAIGAHPDDIEIAAGGALSKMRDSGYQITGLVMTQGERGGNSDTRPVEARRGAKFLGLDEVQVMNFADTYLSGDVVKITSLIEDTIAKTKPDIIFTHSIHDFHQDHQTVYEATMRAARSTRMTILCYESPSVTQDFRPTYYIDVSKYVDVKIRAIREHWDQRKKNYVKSDLVRGKLAFRGEQAKVDYAEGFEVARMVSAI